LFIAEGVEPVNANEIRKIHPMRIWGGWQSKPYSILYSPFREVFSFDADNIALLNPELLFNTPEYQQYGSMFWPDFYSDKWEYWMIKPEAWSLLGLEPQKNVEIETGQVLIDKERNWEALCIAFHFNENSDFYYEKCTYGDTDTYTLAWMMLNKQRYVVPHQPKLLEHMVRIHYTPTGENLFQHSRKWVLPTKDNAHLPTYLRENQCLEWLQVFEDTFLQAQRGA
jgi:Mannosyltransferase putative